MFCLETFCKFPKYEQLCQIYKKAESNMLNAVFFLMLIWILLFEVNNYTFYLLKQRFNFRSLNRMISTVWIFPGGFLNVTINIISEK